MPSRVIREDILDSQRYWSVGIEARQLFFHLMLLADDFGLVSLAPIFVRRRCFDDAPTPAKIDKLIEQMHDADLLRIYTVGDGAMPARYGFIPRFGQRMRQMKARHPKPPEALYADDADALKLFNQHKDLFEKTSATRAQSADKSPPEVEGIRSETSKDTVELKLDAPSPGKDLGRARQLRTAAVELLGFLNEKAGRNYEAVPANIDLIVARFREGATVSDCRAVIAKKCREWLGDPKMNLYLRPATLFKRTNFAQYKGELGATA